MYSKNEASNFNADISDDNAFKSFGYKTRVVGSISAANGIVENARITVSLKYQNKFWKSFKKSLINRKIKLKLECMKHCVLSTSGADDTGPNPNSIFFYYQRHKVICPCCHVFNKDNEKLSKIFKKEFETSGYWNDYNKKLE